MGLSGEGFAARGLNLNLAFGTPSPVDVRDPLAALDAPVVGAMGNVWEWCEDDFHPLPGFEIHQYYDDFSTPCFDGEHSMIFGGSWISTGDEASVWSRFHFRRHFFQSAGFRLASPTSSNASVQTEGGATAGKAPGKTGGPGESGKDSRGISYEDKKLLNEYLMLHYGKPKDVMPFECGPSEALRFPQRCAQLVSKWADELGLPKERALDIGCAVGGSSFELAEGGYREVVGVDLSGSFIEAAQLIQAKGSLPYYRVDQGEIGTWKEAALSPADAPWAERSISFARADACELPAEMEGFDACLLANLLCRLPRPASLLSRMGGGLLRPGGLAVIVSPYTWMEQHTPREGWLGGYKTEDGQDVYSRDTLLKLMTDGGFKLLGEEQMPLLIREHERKYQYIVSHAMAFQKQ